MGGLLELNMQTRCNSVAGSCIRDTQPLTMSHSLGKQGVGTSPELEQFECSNYPETTILRLNSDARPCLSGISAKTTCGILQNAPENQAQSESIMKLQNQKNRAFKTSIVEPKMPPRAMRLSHSNGDCSSASELMEKATSVKTPCKVFVQSPAPYELLHTGESDQEGDESYMSDEDDEDDDNGVDEASSEGDTETCVSENESHTFSPRNNRSTGKSPLSNDHAGFSSSPHIPVRLHFERHENVSGILDNKCGPETKLNSSYHPVNGPGRRSLVFLDQSQEKQQIKQSYSCKPPGDIGRRCSPRPRIQLDSSLKGRPRCNSSSASMKSWNPRTGALLNKKSDCVSNFSKWRSRSMDAATEKSIGSTAIDEDHDPCSVWASQHLEIEESTCPSFQHSLEYSSVKTRSAPLSGSSTRSNARSPKVGSIHFPPSEPSMDKAEELALVAEKLLLHAPSDMEDSNSSQHTSAETSHLSESENEDESFDILPGPPNLWFHRETSMSMNPRSTERGPRRLSVPASVVPVPLGAQRRKSKTEPILSGSSNGLSTSMSTSPRLQVGTNGISLVATPAQASCSTFVNRTNVDGYTSPIPRID